MKRLCAIWLLGLLPALVGADTLVGIVSERSAAELAAGAERFQQSLPEHQVILRTPEQLASLPDTQLQALLEQADALLMAAVFGDQVGRLARLVADQARQREFPILAINGDWQLTRLSRLQGRRVLAQLDNASLKELVAPPSPGDSAADHLAAQQAAFARQRDWLEGRAYYQNRSPQYQEQLLRWLLAQSGREIAVAPPKPRPAVRYYQHGQVINTPEAVQMQPGPAVVVLDLDSGDRPGDRQLLDALCEALEQRELQCLGVLARWGGPTLEAVRTLSERVAPAALTGIVSLQDFTLGGGAGRRAVSEALETLAVPVLKGIRLVERTEPQWRLSADGVPHQGVHYRLAMPELQGVSQPMVLAVAQLPTLDPLTGVRLTLTRPLADRVDAMAERLRRWQTLRAKANADKKIALVYYNHPPGRHNVGADNLDVPASLFEMLHWLREAGYHTGELPDSPAALLEMIQQRGVNLPEDHQALRALKGQVPSLSARAYRDYLETLPAVIREELRHGPLGYLHARLQQAITASELTLAKQVLERGIKDLRHLLEHQRHPARQRALDLLDQYQQGWRQYLSEGEPPRSLTELRDALLATDIPGLSGWGAAPGRSMVVDDTQLFPGLRFGNIFIGPQPPRGWEIDEALLHANTTFPPTHQYLGFYHWLRDHFQADALVYVGRHSTHEFLPRRRAGLTGDDYPDLLGGALPLIYPYIVDGVGEGIQAKRRALGVMISHLTPPLAATDLYDELLEIRQLVETYEVAVQPDSPSRKRAVRLLRERIAQLNLTRELENNIAEDLGLTAGEVTLDEVSEELLVHEAGHYVTDMQERFMPLGLHVFGRDWQDSAVDTMLASMAGKDASPKPAWRQALKASPAQERRHWLAALSGRFVPPGQGNDPLRTPAVLPTGRNFHALSGDLIPTRVAWSLGSEMASQVRQKPGKAEGSEALVLWASDTVRDEGVMLAFGLDMLGVRPRWNARGIIEGLERLPLGEQRRQRRDVLFTTSGLFRDLYEDQLVWLDLAVRLALQGASETIKRDYPTLRAALDIALEPLPDDMRQAGTENLRDNKVAAAWVADAGALLTAGNSARQAGEQAALRVFGTAPGAYGAGVNRLANRSGAWQDRAALGQAYRRRMGHAYGKQQQGEAAHDALDARLARVGSTYLGRASHLYGLLDNDDGFDYQGGLSTAVEFVAGQAPRNHVLQHADPSQPRVERLEQALLGELRARNLNPQWLKPLMRHDYAGARTMGSDFVDNLWGWQVTSPQVVQSWVWDEVNAVYFQDKHDLGLDTFLAGGANIHVRTHMQATALLAAKRGYWQAEAQTLEGLVEEFAQAVIDHGLPGSGHTRPGHPLLDWVAERLPAEQQAAFDAVREKARAKPPQAKPVTTTVRPVQQKNTEPVSSESAASASKPAGGERDGWRWLMGAAVLLLLGGLLQARTQTPR